MSKHWKDPEGVVHSEGESGDDLMLCGDAPEGADFDVSAKSVHMTETVERIDCDRCIRLIRFAKSINSREYDRLYWPDTRAVRA